MPTVFRRTNDIFTDEDVLTDGYQPKEIKQRDKEMEEYKTYLQPVINGATPRNIFLYGKTGVGKTAVTKHLLTHLNQDAQEYGDLDITILRLNCEDFTSSYRVGVALVNKLRDKSNQISVTGYPLATVYDMLWEELDTVGGTILIVLDEIDYVSHDDSILYQIPRARSNGNIEDAKLGIIGISNDFKFREHLDPRVKDTLCEREIHFPPYDGTQLHHILSDRAKLAFQDGVLDEEVVPLCAAFAAQDTGSARQGLSLLTEAGYFARRDEAKEVTESHIRDAKEHLEKQKIEESMRDLTSQGHLVLCAVVAVAINDPESMPERKQAFFERYLRMAQKQDRDAFSGRTFHNHLRELDMLGILQKYDRNKGERGGRYYEYNLDVSVDAALQALENARTSTELEFGELRKAAKAKGIT